MHMHRAVLRPETIFTRYRLLRTFAGASFAPNGPPSARAPSLSGRGPPIGRPSSPGHSAPLFTAEFADENPPRVLCRRLL